jgi:hypothetical protein
MTNTLTQRRLLTVQEFEITEDSVNVRIKPPFKEAETLSVFLTVLNPEPVIRRDRLEFNSRVNGEALLSLYLAKPNAQEFNAFVGALKERAQAAYQGFAGLRSSPGPSQAPGQLAEEPPEPEDGEALGTTVVRQEVDVASIETSIRMLRTYLDSEDIGPLLSVLEAVREDPRNESNLERRGEVFGALGPTQGAVLTYAPYIISLLSDDPYGFKEPSEPA